VSAAPRQKPAWTPLTALRDVVEILGIIAFVLVVPPLLEQVLLRAGVATTGANRIIATSILFILWALFALFLLRLNRERLDAVGLVRPPRTASIIVLGFALAGALFALVVGLEALGYGRGRLGDIASELKGDMPLLAARMAISVLIVGFVEEFIFRGFLMLRFATLFGGSRAAWALALASQAVLFGLSHGYQGLYGIMLTAAFGLAFGATYLGAGRNLWIVAIGHGVYDAAHAFYLAMA
jgi:membrane protease YdiL (CAAX protease family)